MKKRSIITIMMVITLSTVVFTGCDNNKIKNSKEDTKVETSINNKQDSENISTSEQEKKKDANEEDNNSEKVNKPKIENKKVNENKDKKQDKKTESSKFTPQGAIEIAKRKYGTQNGDILYSYKEEPYISGNKEGYYVKLSSKTMIEQGGTGTLTWILVTNDGKIIEDPKMN